MLVLSRKKGESILLGDGIEVTILDVSGEGIKIGISAPPEIRILRKELYESVKEMNVDSSIAGISAIDLKKQFDDIRKK
jgi:carbon storage regulator